MAEQKLPVPKPQEPQEPQKLTPSQQQAADEARDKIRRKKEEAAPTTKTEMGKVLKKGGSVKTSAYARGGGIEQRGKTKGRFV
jgi:hypothetical protein